MTSQYSLNIDGIFGSLLISCLVASLLLGVTSAQFYVYLKKFSDDPIWLKSLAFIVWGFEVCHQIIFIHISYIFLVRNYGNPEIITDAPKSVQALSIFSGLIGFIIYQFSQSRVLLGFLCLLAAASLGLVAWSTTIMGDLKNNLLSYIKDRLYVCFLSLGLAAFTDVNISVAMIWLLRRRKMDALQGGLSHALDRLVVWTVETVLHKRSNGVLRYLSEYLATYIYLHGTVAS
ncbi:hypothetical protein DL96DRAFT_1794561 [Flagelloscypha sp. PMI_526]|nr:hypothetical protein DL96DRAFT_1794561 [Flagelloscypha sp. PMI_526]